VEKFQGNPNFLQPFCRAPISVNRGRQSAKIPHLEKIGKIEIFRVTRISHLPNFDTTSVPVHSVDGESLSEIAIHNFEKSWKIEIRILRYGSQPCIYLFPL